MSSRIGSDRPSLCFPAHISRSTAHPERRLKAWWLAALLATFFCAYVIGRAVGILLGVGPYPTQVIAILLVVVATVRRVRRSR